MTEDGKQSYVDPLCSWPSAAGNPYRRPAWASFKFRAGRLSCSWCISNHNTSPQLACLVSSCSGSPIFCQVDEWCSLTRQGVQGLYTGGGARSDCRIDEQMQCQPACHTKQSKGCCIMKCVAHPAPAAVAGGKSRQGVGEWRSPCPTHRRKLTPQTLDMPTAGPPRYESAAYTVVLPFRGCTCSEMTAVVNANENWY